MVEETLEMAEAVDAQADREDLEVADVMADQVMIAEKVVVLQEVMGKLVTKVTQEVHLLLDHVPVQVAETRIFLVTRG